MQDFPHRYLASGQTEPDTDVELNSAGLETLTSAGPTQFGGPGDKWSPETLITAAVADCFILGFKAIARASRFSWTSLRCEVEGELDRIDHVTRFTQFKVRATLEVPPDADRERAQHLLEKAEAACLITNSLTSETHLETVINEAS